jgi:hypothetical protein
MFLVSVQSVVLCCDARPKKTLYKQGLSNVDQGSGIGLVREKIIDSLFTIARIHLVHVVHVSGTSTSIHSDR